MRPAGCGRLDPRGQTLRLGEAGLLLTDLGSQRGAGGHERGFKVRLLLPVQQSHRVQLGRFK